jgi:hypothetical protein
MFVTNRSWWPTAIVLLSISVTPSPAAAQLSTAPTANCHVTDGAITACANGQTEWADVQPLVFPDTNSFLYVNQDAARTFLYLLYDFPFRTAPVRAGEAIHVRFNTVSQDNGTPGLDRYDVYIFGDGHIQVFEQGEPTAPGRIVGAAGFGNSPNSSSQHAMAELQVPLTPGAPTAYSPDPLFWSATVPPPPTSPPPPPPPDPCPTDPGKTYNKCLKAEMNNAQATAAEMSLYLLTAGGLCSSFAALACAPLEPALIALGVVWGSTAIELGRKLGADPPGVDFAVPPDPNYTVIAQPATYSLSLPTFGVTAEQAAAFDAFAANTRRLIAFEQAATIALARAEGASAAGSAEWVNNQSQAARRFSGQSGALIAELPLLLRDLANAVRGAGTQFTITPADFRGLLESIRTTADPSEVQQVFVAAEQLVFDALQTPAADQALFLPLLFSLDPQAVETFGSGAFPEGLVDPTIGSTFQPLGSDLVQAAPSNTALSPSLQITLPGDYVAAGVGLRGGVAPSYGPSLTAASIALTGIPPGASVARAFLYWGALDNSLEPSLFGLNLNGTRVTGFLTGSGPDTCWGRASSFTFRADVTPLVTGNGTYSLTDVPGGGAILPEGASLVVLYQSDGLPIKTVILADGNVSMPSGTSTGTATFTGFVAADPVSAATTFIVGDGQLQQGAATSASFTGSLGTLTIPNVFGAKDGPLWDTETVDVSGVVGAGPGPGAATLRVLGDCVLWSAQAFSVSSTAATTPVTATAAVVQANRDGDTIEVPRGLDPADAPTLEDQIRMIVQSRVVQDPSTSTSELTRELVESLPPAILPPDQAAALISAVTSRVVAPPDAVPPVTSATASPAANGNGWNKSNATLIFSAVDNQNGSGVAQLRIVLTGAQTASLIVPGSTASVVITAEGATTVAYFAIDNAGNQEPRKVLTVLVDKTPPTAVAVASPAANVNGWNNTSVTVGFTGADTLSGIDVCSPAITLNREGFGQVVAGACTDKAGNVSSPAAQTVSIDLTAPEAYAQFDPATTTAQVFGRDALSGVPPTAVAGVCVPSDRDRDDEASTDDERDDDEPHVKGLACTYRIVDRADNVLTLTARARRFGSDDDHHQAELRVMSTQHNNGPVTAAPVNNVRFSWSQSRDGSLNQLDQRMVVGQENARKEVDAHFEASRNRTVIRVYNNSPADDGDERGRAAIITAGLRLLRLATRAGSLDIEF